MKIKRKILIPIFALAYLAILAIASIPPPPVNQNFGINDTMMINYTEPLCRGCHNSTSSPLVAGGVPTRHHNLVATKANNPYTSQAFSCVDCHPSTPGIGMGILLDRNCMDCHNSTAFWGDSVGAHVGNFTRPHHNTTMAQARNCKFCHGASVDNYNDTHYVPPYPESEISPSALYKAYNGTSGRVWGGCLACHAANASNNPPIFFTDTFPSLVDGKYSQAPIATGTNNVHHSEILTVTGGTPVGEQCTWCHVDVLNVLDIRGCETCHSVRSIHNIQFDFANTSTLRGYGHIGSNNPSDPANDSWDCMGCHAWYDAGSTNPFAGAITPDVQSATPNVFNANSPTVVTLSGTNFVQYNSTTVVNIDDQINLTPDTISNAQITVSVNLAAGAHYIKVVKTDAVENLPTQSDIKPLTVVPVVTISSATLSGTTLTVSGVGLGSKPVTNAEQNVIAGSAGYSASIVSWTDTQIVATVSSSVVVGNAVQVITANSGQATATIVASVSKQVLTTITVTPSPVTVRLGNTQTFTATAKDQNGQAMKGIVVAWSSSNTNIGTVSPSSATTDAYGHATTKFATSRRQKGTLKVTAKSGTVSGVATVTVK
jgi:hypothetical protein